VITPDERIETKMLTAVCISETSVNLRHTTGRNKPEDSYLHTRSREDLKSLREKKLSLCLWQNKSGGYCPITLVWRSLSGQLVRKASRSRDQVCPCVRSSLPSQLINNSYWMCVYNTMLANPRSVSQIVLCTVVNLYWAPDSTILLHKA
jgi:hypothetical protein